MPYYAIDRVLTGDKPVRVWQEKIVRTKANGRRSITQRWVAEVGKPSDDFALIGRGRTIKAAIADLGPRAYDMDFDSVSWKARFDLGTAGMV